jgi:adenylylsulfate kinase-like enzyme
MDAKARAGLIENFIGVSDPYEAEQDAELVIDTTKLTPAEAAEAILLTSSRVYRPRRRRSAPVREPGRR